LCESKGKEQMVSHKMLNLISFIFLVLSGIGLAIIDNAAEWIDKSPLRTSLINWYMRIAIVGWIGSILMHVII
jgi:hypothetical protein